MLYLYYKTYEYRKLERSISIGETANEKRKDGIVDWVRKLEEKKRERVKRGGGEGEGEGSS